MKDKKPCAKCGEDNPELLSRHHVYPRRFWGVGASNNTIVYLCNVGVGCNGHQRLERLITKRENGKRQTKQFYRQCLEDFLNQPD